MESKFGMEYDAKVAPGSSAELGAYITFDLKIIVKKGYFGGSIPRGEYNNPYYQTIAVFAEFRDGTSTSFWLVDTMGKYPDWREQVEQWLQHVADSSEQISHHMAERDRLDEAMKPLQKSRSKHADKLFKIVEKQEQEAKTNE